MAALKSTFLASALPLIALLSCSGSRNQVGFDTPEDTFVTVMTAVAKMDIDLYRRCFTADAIERGEAMLAKYEKNPNAFWNELDGIFRGKQLLTVTERGTTARGTVDAPEAEGGGIGTITFEKVEGEWKIAAW